MLGDVRASLVDSDDQAAIDVVFSGNMSASMNGSRGPVTVRARGDAEIVATKRLLLDESGFRAHRATSRVGLRTRLTGASTRFRSRLLDRSVSRLALRFAQREKGTADAQATREARRLMPSVAVVGAGAPRLANTSCLAVPGRRAETLVIALDLQGLAVSAGAACASGKAKRSAVLDAMGLGQLAETAIRVSLGWTTRETDIEAFLRAFSAIVSETKAA